MVTMPKRSKKPRFERQQENRRRVATVEATAGEDSVPIPYEPLSVAIEFGCGADMGTANEMSADQLLSLSKVPGTWCDAVVCSRLCWVVLRYRVWVIASRGIHPYLLRSMEFDKERAHTIDVHPAAINLVHQLVSRGMKAVALVQFSDVDCENIAARLKKSHVSSLSLRNCERLTRAGLTSLSVALPLVEEWSINAADSVELDKWLNTLARSTNIKRLRLHHMLLDGNTMKAVSRHSSLELLDLSGSNGYQGSDFGRLAALPRLTVLNLSQTSLSLAVASQLVKLPKLRILLIRSCSSLPSEAIAEIALIGGLKVLDATSNSQFGNSCLVHLAEHSSLLHLHADLGHLSPPAIAHFRAAKPQTRLEETALDF